MNTRTITPIRLSTDARYLIKFAVLVFGAAGDTEIRYNPLPSRGTTKIAG
jgi:hypothetical protein